MKLISLGVKDKQSHIVQTSATFKITIGCFAIVGFAQLMAVGMAYTVRSGQVKEVVRFDKTQVAVLRDVVEKEVVKLVEVPFTDNADTIIKRYNITPNQRHQPIVQQDDSSVFGGEVSITPRKVMTEWVIRHPKVGKLMEKAELAYRHGDMGAAVMAVEEARLLDSTEPAVIYLLARISEDMEALQAAREHYLTIFQMGVVAGKYYRVAADKLENGVGRRIAEGVLMHLGKVNINRSANPREVSLVVPIKSKKGEFIIGDNVEIQVHFYDRVNGLKIEPAAKNANIKSLWLNTSVDWNTRGEEMLQVRYSIPQIDEVQQHLYGKRAYYGQVVELYYKGELQDIVAFPSVLHKEHAKLSRPRRDNLAPLDLLDNFNLDNPLLPAKPQGDDSGLPTR